MWIRQLKNEMDTLLMTKYSVTGKPEELIQICTVTKMVKKLPSIHCLKNSMEIEHD
jgi:hypothetical protein